MHLPTALLPEPMSPTSVTWVKASRTEGGSRWGRTRGTRLVITDLPEVHLVNSRRR